MKRLLKASVYTLTIVGVLGLGLSSTMAQTTSRTEQGVMYTTDGSVNWSRSVSDPLVNWTATYQGEITEDKANNVTNAVKAVADFAQSMAAANAAYNQAVDKAERASNALTRLSELEDMANSLFSDLQNATTEQDKAGTVAALQDVVNQIAERTGADPKDILQSVDLSDPAAAARAQVAFNDVVAGKIDQAKSDLEAATVEVNKAIDAKNALNEKVLAQEAILAEDQATAARLLSEAGVTDVSRLNEAFADPAQRAQLQENLNAMYDTYWSDVPKIDLNTQEGQDYTKSFLTALSGQSQAEEQQAHMVASETAGGQALAAYEERRATEEATKRAQITEKADSNIREQEQRKAENQALSEINDEYLGGKYLKAAGAETIYDVQGRLIDQNLKTAQQDRLAVDSAYDGAASASFTGGTMLPNVGESQASYEARLSAWNGTMGQNNKSIYTEEGMSSYMNARDMGASMNGETYNAATDPILNQVGQTAATPVLGPTVENAEKLNAQQGSWSVIGSGVGLGGYAGTGVGQTDGASDGGFIGSEQAR